MNGYTKLGYGDCTPEYQEDTRPQCEHCNNHHDGDGDYCSEQCYQLDQQVIYEN